MCLHRYIFKCSQGFATAEFLTIVLAYFECIYIFILNVFFLQVCVSEFKSRIYECLHTRTLSRMLESFDAQTKVIPDIAVGN